MDELILSAPQHTSEKIKTAAIHLIRQKNIPVSLDVLCNGFKK
ncbi:hypothetical protein [Ferruginibacter sp.]|nr:hypothetical protein [Ferruginibacter sp.]